MADNNEFEINPLKQSIQEAMLCDPLSLLKAIAAGKMALSAAQVEYDGAVQKEKDITTEIHSMCSSPIEVAVYLSLDKVSIHTDESKEKLQDIRAAVPVLQKSVHRNLVNHGLPNETQSFQILFNEQQYNATMDSLEGVSAIIDGLRQQFSKLVPAEDAPTLDPKQARDELIAAKLELDQATSTLSHAKEQLAIAQEKWNDWTATWAGIRASSDHAEIVEWMEE